MHAIGRWLWDLVPGNPLVMRVILNSSRRLRHLLVRAGYLGALVLLVVVSLLAGGAMSRTVNLSELAKAGTQVFALIAYTQVVLICLLSPLFMASAISQEQSGQTLRILLTTPLTNLQLVTGFLTSRLMLIWALLLSGLPLFSVLLIFGGVPISSVFVSFIVAAMAALVVGAIAVSLAVMEIGGRRGVFLFVIAVAAYMVIVFALDHSLRSTISPITGTAVGQVTLLTPLHPLLVLESALNPVSYQTPAGEELAGYGAIMRFYRGRPLATYVVLSTVVSGTLLLLCMFRVRAGDEGVSNWIQWQPLRRALRLGAAKRQHPARTVWHNPIAWREAQTRGNGTSSILARWGFVAIAMLSGVALLLAYHFGGLPDSGGGNAAANQADFFKNALLALLLTEIAAIALVAVYMSAGCVSREREDGTLDLMLTTPITPRYYIWGKLRGLVSFLGMMLAVPLATVLLVAMYCLIASDAKAQMKYLTVEGNTVMAPLVPLASPVLLALMLVPFAALCVAVGVHWSLKSRGVVGAVAASLGVLGVFTLVMGWCGFSAAQELPMVGSVINAFSPMTNVMMLLSPWETVRDYSSNEFGGTLNLLLSSLLAAAGYGLVVYGMIGAMVRGFDRTMRKLSGTK